MAAVSGRNAVELIDEEAPVFVISVAARLADMHPQTLRGYDRVLVPEMNSGQLALLLRGTYLVDVRPYNRVRGLPFTTAELTEQIHTLLKELSA